MIGRGIFRWSVARRSKRPQHLSSRLWRRLLIRHREPPLGGVAIQSGVRAVRWPWIASSLRSSQ
jgi:hypothetical protein